MKFLEERRISETRKNRRHRTVGVEWSLQRPEGGDWGDGGAGNHSPRQHRTIPGFQDTPTANPIPGFQDNPEGQAKNAVPTTEHQPGRTQAGPQQPQDRTQKHNPQPSCTPNLNSQNASHAATFRRFLSPGLASGFPAAPRVRRSKIGQI